MFKLPPRRGTNRCGAQRYRAEHPDRGFRETAAMQQVRHPECACDPPTDGQVQEGILNVRPLHRQSDLGRARRPVSADDGYTAAQSAAALQRLCGLRKMGMPGDAGHSSSAVKYRRHNITERNGPNDCGASQGHSHPLLLRCCLPAPRSVRLRGQ
jgi:hypothetical protein